MSFCVAAFGFASGTANAAIVADLPANRSAESAVLLSSDNDAARAYAVGERESEPSTPTHPGYGGGFSIGGRTPGRGTDKHEYHRESEFRREAEPPAVVPVPAAFWLFGSGLAAIRSWRRRAG